MLSTCEFVFNSVLLTHFHDFVNRAVPENTNSASSNTVLVGIQELPDLFNLHVELPVGVWRDLDLFPCFSCVRFHLVQSYEGCYTQVILLDKLQRFLKITRYHFLLVRELSNYTYVLNC